MLHLNFYKTKRRPEKGRRRVKQIKLRSFDFIALKATSANVFRSNDAVVYNSDFLNVCIVRTRCLTVTVADFIAG